MAIRAQQSGSDSSGSSVPGQNSTRVPIGKSTGSMLTIVVEPSCSGRSSIRRLPVMTVSLPREARTAPATTRSPLPSAPRVGRRHSLDDTIGRAMLNSDEELIDGLSFPVYRRTHSRAYPSNSFVTGMHSIAYWLSLLKTSPPQEPWWFPPHPCCDHSMRGERRGFLLDRGLLRHGRCGGRGLVPLDRLRLARHRAGEHLVHARDRN